MIMYLPGYNIYHVHLFHVTLFDVEVFDIIVDERDFVDVDEGTRNERVM